MYDWDAIIAAVGRIKNACSGIKKPNPRDERGGIRSCEWDDSRKNSSWIIGLLFLLRVTTLFCLLCVYAHAYPVPKAIDGFLRSPTTYGNDLCVFASDLCNFVEIYIVLNLLTLRENFPRCVTEGAFKRPCNHYKVALLKLPTKKMATKLPLHKTAYWWSHYMLRSLNKVPSRLAK